MSNLESRILERVNRYSREEASAYKEAVRSVLGYLSDCDDYGDEPNADMLRAVIAFELEGGRR